MINNRSTQKSALLSFGLSLLLLPFLLAEEARPVTFRGMSAEGDVGSIYFTNAKGEPEEFLACDYMRSKFYRAAGATALVFYKIIPAEIEGEEPTREVVGSAPWPVGDGPFLVLASKSGDNYDFSVAADDDRSFPFGSFRVINASRHKVHVLIGDKTATLEPGASKVLNPLSSGEKKGVPFQLAIESIPDRLMFSTVWSRMEAARTLVFVLNRPNPQHPVDVKRVREDDKFLKAQRAREELEAKEAKKR